MVGPKNNFKICFWDQLYNPRHNFESTLDENQHQNNCTRIWITGYWFLRPMQTDPTLLANNTQHCGAQQCCDLLRPFAWNHNNVRTCCEKFETGQTFRPMQTDATLLANNTQQCWELLALVAFVCMGL